MQKGPKSFVVDLFVLTFKLLFKDGIERVNWILVNPVLKHLLKEALQDEKLLVKWVRLNVNQLSDFLLI
jgi:hypothetical protein